MHTINLPYKQGYVTPVPAAVVVNTYEFREAEDPSIQYLLAQLMLENTAKMAKDIRPDKKLSKRSIVHSAKAKGEAKQPGKEQAGRLNRQE